jgi:hypothetical protein
MCGLLDSGYATIRIYGVCQKSNGFFHPSKGAGSTFGSRISKTVLPEFPGLVLYTYVDHAIKSELFIDRMKNSTPAIHIPKDSGEEFLRGLSNQQLVPRKTGKGSEYVWRKVDGDHFSDALKLCHVAWHVLKGSIV